MNAPNVWQTVTTAHDAGFQAVDAGFETILPAEVGVICDAHQAVKSQCDAGTANRATVIGAVAAITADASTCVRNLADAFGADVGAMPPTSRLTAYAMLVGWWEGACDAAHELTAPEPEPAPEREPEPDRPPVDATDGEVAAAGGDIGADSELYREPEPAPEPVSDPIVQTALAAYVSDYEGADPPEDIEAARKMIVPEPPATDEQIAEARAEQDAQQARFAEARAEQDAQEAERKAADEAAWKQRADATVTDDGTDEPATKATTTGDQIADAREVALRNAPREVDDVYKNCVWLSIVFSRMGTSRTADVTATTADGADVTSSTRTTKVILSGCKEWAAIQAADTRFRLDVRQLAVPTSLRGIYPIPLAAMEAVENMIQTYEAERAKLVEALVTAYDGAVLADRDALPRGLWDPEDYPPRAYVRQTYRMSATWKDLSASTRLTTAMAKRNAEAAAAEQREAFAEVRAGLRVWAASVLDELLTALKPDETGTLRRFTDNRITKMQAVIESFATRDVTDDKELQQLLGRTRNVLAGIPDISDLRKDETFRAATAAKLDEVRDGLRTLGVGDASPRKMRSAKRKRAA